MELSTAQKKIVEATESKIVVIASAAAGKTAVLTERTRYLLEHGADPTKMVLITFTNAAAEELADRLNTPKDCLLALFIRMPIIFFCRMVKTQPTCLNQSSLTDYLKE